MHPNLEAGESLISDASGLATFPLKPNFPVVVLAESTLNSGMGYLLLLSKM